jgi:hypothetical protein
MLTLCPELHSFKETEDGIALLCLSLWTKRSEPLSPGSPGDILRGGVIPCN